MFVTRFFFIYNLCAEMTLPVFLITNAKTVGKNVFLGRTYIHCNNLSLSKSIERKSTPKSFTGLPVRGNLDRTIIHEELPSVGKPKNKTHLRNIHARLRIFVC